MKLKQLPEDFQVEEIPRVQAGSTGPFAFYKLEKTGWTTPDALAVLQRRWGIDSRRIGYGGLKDRHAHTTQHLTIFRGPKRGLQQQGIRVDYLGQLSEAYNSGDIERNRFRLVLRDLKSENIAGLSETANRIALEGVPNYFDDQRFGSVSDDGEFIARLLVRGKFEEALRLAVAAPYEHDRNAQKKEKRLLAAHWGDWDTLRTKLPPGETKRIVEYLRVKPDDFRGAFLLLRSDLRALYLSAYQSHLWNRILAVWLGQRLSAEHVRSVSLRLGELPFHADLNEHQMRELLNAVLPLPSARLKLAEDDPLAIPVGQVLSEEGLTLRDLQVRGVRELFFSRGDRPVLCLPTEMTYRFENDELHAGRQKMLLSFDLPRGSYATLIVKRLEIVA